MLLLFTVFVVCCCIHCVGFSYAGFLFCGAVLGTLSILTGKRNVTVINMWLTNTNCTSFPWQES